MLQLWSSAEHSSTSGGRERKKCEKNVNDRTQSKQWNVIFLGRGDNLVRFFCLKNVWCSIKLSGLQTTWQLRYCEHVLTHTLDAVSHPAVSTATFKASRHVDAGSMHVTVMSPDLTLINIWREMEINYSTKETVTLTFAPAISLWTLNKTTKKNRKNVTVFWSEMLLY